jgi:hypothetical protein
MVMHQAFVLMGSVVDGQTLRLDEPLPMTAGKVRVFVEVVEVEARSSYAEVMEKIRADQRARGFVSPTRDQVDTYLKAERESWDD